MSIQHSIFCHFRSLPVMCPGVLSQINVSISSIDNRSIEIMARISTMHMNRIWDAYLARVSPSIISGFSQCQCSVFVGSPYQEWSVELCHAVANVVPYSVA